MARKKKWKWEEEPTRTALNFESVRPRFPLSLFLSYQAKSLASSEIDPSKWLPQASHVCILKIIVSQLLEMINFTIDLFLFHIYNLKLVFFLLRLTINLFIFNIYLFYLILLIGYESVINY